MNDCTIVRDLIPLQADDLLSSDSVEFIRNHIAVCDECRQVWERARTPLPEMGAEDPTAERQVIQKALRKDRMKTVLRTILTTLLVLAIPTCYILQTLYEYGFLYDIEASYPSPDGNCVLELVDRDSFGFRSNGYEIRFNLNRDGGTGINRYKTGWDSIEPYWAPNGTDLLLMTTDVDGNPGIYIVDTSEHHHKGGTYEIPDMTADLIPALMELCREQADYQDIRFTFHSWQEDSTAVVFNYETDLGQSGQVTYHYSGETNTDAQ